VAGAGRDGLRATLASARRHIIPHFARTHLRDKPHSPSPIACPSELQQIFLPPSQLRVT
ncbi:hypothetical protein HAX54_049897, partial [Datura stramonium]|nr:hypothetical protein [Datura stramonium]